MLTCGFLRAPRLLASLRCERRAATIVLDRQLTRGVRVACLASFGRPDWTGSLFVAGRRHWTGPPPVNVQRSFSGRWFHSAAAFRRSTPANSDGAERSSDPFWLFKPRLWLRGTRPSLSAVFPLIWLSVAGWMFILFLTTTAVSVLVLVSRTLGFQKWLLEHACNRMTKRLGFSISIERADVDGWIDGRVVLHNVAIKRASAEAPLQLDLHIDELSITLSLESMHVRGPLRTLHAKKVRGHVDTRGYTAWKRQRAQLSSAPASSSSTATITTTTGGDEFDLDECLLDDCEVNVQTDDLDMPVRLSIYRASLDRLRQSWLLFDLLTANYIDGALNEALFSCRRLSAFSPPAASHASLTSQRYFAHERNYATYDFRFNKVPLELLSKQFPDASPLSAVVAGTADIRLRVEMPILHKYICYDRSDVLYDQDVRVSADMQMRNLLALHPYALPQLSNYARLQFASVVNYVNSHAQHIPLAFDFRSQLSAFRQVHFLSETNLYALFAAAAVDKIKENIEKTNLAADPDFIPFVVSLSIDWFEFFRTVAYGILAS